MVAFTRFVLTASLVGFAVAQNAFRVTNPSADVWWVAKSANVLAWTCNDSPVKSFTVLIANKDPAILAAPIAIIAAQNNFDCSKVITQDQANQTPSTGYRILLTNPLNNTEIFAQSEEFEIKPLGSPYPVRTTSSTNHSATRPGSGATASKTSDSGTPITTISSATSATGSSPATASGSGSDSDSDSPGTTTSSGQTSTVGSGAAASVTASASPQQNNGAVSKGSNMGVAAAFAAGLVYLM